MLNRQLTFYLLVNVLREDVAVKGLDRDVMMQNVKEQEDGLVKVPPIITE